MNDGVERRTEPIEINPYQSPATVPSQPPEPEPRPVDVAKILRNLRAVCLLYLLFGILGPIAVTTSVIQHQPGTPSTTVWIIVVLCLATVVGAVGFLRGRAWGLRICRLVSFVFLLSFPFGTILGVYFLLNVDKVRHKFH